MLLLNTSIADFHKKYYKPAIEKLAFHLPHVIILGTNHCGKLRKKAFKRRMSSFDAKSRHDYAERLVAEFANHIQSEYYSGNRSCSMEGIALEHFKSDLSNTIGDAQNDNHIKSIFFSFLLDNSKQDGATCAAHTKRLLETLIDSRVIKQGESTLWEATNGCAESYRCATAIYLLSVVAHALNINIDRAIGAPGHGKDVVDGLNAVDKSYLTNLMNIIQIPEKAHPYKSCICSPHKHWDKVIIFCSRMSMPSFYAQS